ncbi:MAG: hypothetical protein AB1505_37020, partial [Candidatus Latescibacterota bacterium]
MGETAPLTRRIGTVALGRAAGTVSLLAVSAVLARAWPSEDMAGYLVVWTAVSALVPVFLLGLPTALLYFYPRLEAAGRQRLVRQTVVCLGASAALLAGLLALCGEQAAAWLGSGAGPLDRRLGGWLLAFLPYAFSQVVGGFVESALVAAGRQAVAAVLAAGA